MQAAHHASQTPEAREDRKPASPVLPFILIALGVLFLLDALGWLGASVWGILFQFWPLALVAVGVDLLSGGRYRRLILAAVLVTGALLAAGSAWFGWNLLGSVQGATQTHTVAQVLSGAQRADVTLTSGVGAFRLEAGSDPNMLVAGSVQTGGSERLEQDFRLDGNAAVYRLESRSQGGSVRFFPGGEPRAWQLALNPQLPLSLSVTTGVGSANLDLSQLTLEDLVLRTGVGSATVTLPGRGQFSADISSGVGALTIRIPAGMAARIETSRGVGALSVRGDFQQQGSLYLSPAYDGAPERLDLRVRGGVGQVVIESF